MYILLLWCIFGISLHGMEELSRDIQRCQIATNAKDQVYRIIMQTCSDFFEGKIAPTNGLLERKQQHRPKNMTDTQLKQASDSMWQDTLYVAFRIYKKQIGFPSTDKEFEVLQKLAMALLCESLNSDYMFSVDKLIPFVRLALADQGALQYHQNVAQLSIKKWARSLPVNDAQLMKNYIEKAEKISSDRKLARMYHLYAALLMREADDQEKQISHAFSVATAKGDISAYYGKALWDFRSGPGNGPRRSDLSDISHRSRSGSPLCHGGCGRGRSTGALAGWGGLRAGAAGAAPL